MAKFINFINKHKRFFSIINCLICVGMFFIPYACKSFSDGLFYQESFYTNLISLLANVDKRIIQTLIAIDIILMSLILLSGASCIFIKYHITLLFPSLTTLIVFIVALIRTELTPYLGFYFSLLLMVFWTVYFIADIIINHKPKVKKPTAKDRIAALEKEIYELKNRKDDD